MTYFHAKNQNFCKNGSFNAQKRRFMLEMA